MGNVDRIGRDDVEFLFADHHGYDDAAARIADRFAGDPRVRVITTSDQIRWFENYALLMEQGRGDFVRIVTQDDPVVPGFLDDAIAALDTRPDAVGVLGPIDLIDETGEVFLRDTRRGDRRAWTRTGDAFGTLAGWRNDACTHGLWRRQVLLDHDLRLEPSHLNTVLTVRTFAAGMALHGPILWVPGYESLRRVHRGSYTATFWRKTPLDQVRRLADYAARSARLARRHSPNRVAGALRAPLLALGALSIPLVRIPGRFGSRARAERRALGR